MTISLTKKIQLSIISLSFIAIGLSLFSHAVSLAFIGLLAFGLVFLATQILRSD